jgi:peptidoglycan/LPS O-acetylase OafA/YrhL
LDGLRGIAILMVFMIHSGAPAVRAMGPIGNSFVDHGKYGVTVFFVVSAFSLCLSLSRAFDGKSVSWQSYFVRRFFRIAPLYYLVLAYTMLSGFTAMVPHSGHAETLIYHLTFANIVAPWFANDIIGVEWSIAVEWAFYMLLPAIIVLCRLQYGLAVLILISASLFWWRDQITIALGQSFFENRNYTILSHLYSFTIGIFVYLAVAKNWIGVGLRRALTILSAIMVAFLLWRGENGWSGLMIATITGVAIVNASAGHMAVRILSWRLITFVGMISYSVYLLHFIVISHYFAIGHYFGELVWMSGLSLLGVLGMLFLTIAFATLTYYAIEQPFRILGGKLTQQMMPVVSRLPRARPIAD